MQQAKHIFLPKLFYLFLYGLLEMMAFLYSAWQMLVLCVPYIDLLPLPILLLGPAWIFRKRQRLFFLLLGIGAGLWSILLVLRLLLDLWLPL